MEEQHAEPGVHDSLETWLNWLEASRGSRIDLGLARVHSAWSVLHDVEQPIAPMVITVAGTNGKGSTCHVLEALAIAHGFSVGMYTSPHLIAFNERCRINGSSVNDDVLVEAFARVKASVDHESLTYFEFTTLAILWAFSSMKLDVAILEVGLGGRLDAVNVIDADVAVITSVHRDHAAFLGTDLDGIAGEKAGIARVGRPLVIGDANFSSSQVRRLESDGVRVCWAGRDYFVGTDGYGQPTWSRGHNEGGLESGEAPRELALPASHVLPINMAAALQGWSFTGLRMDKSISQGVLAQVNVPGRQQWLRKSQFPYLPWDVLVDVAHNEQSVAALIEAVAKVRDRYARIHSVMGFLNDKLAPEMVKPMRRWVDTWSGVSTHGERGVSEDDLAAFMQGQGVMLDRVIAGSGSNDWSALNAIAASDDDLVVVWGSFHVVGPFLEWVQSLSNNS